MLEARDPSPSPGRRCCASWPPIGCTGVQRGGSSCIGYAQRVKIEMRTTISDAEQDALEAWVYEHANEFDTVAVYRVGLTMYRAGMPPTTVVHHPGHIADALADALAVVRGNS